MGGLLSLLLALWIRVFLVGYRVDAGGAVAPPALSSPPAHPVATQALEGLGPRRAERAHLRDASDIAFQPGTARTVLLDHVRARRQVLPLDRVRAGAVVARSTAVRARRLMAVARLGAVRPRRGVARSTAV